MPRGMNIRRAMKDFLEALHFILSLEFWRMGLFWTLSLLWSYFQLFVQSSFTMRPEAYPRCLPPKSGPHRPVCVITGATSGLGAAAAFALSKEGFYIVLAGRSTQKLLQTMDNIRMLNKDAHLKAFEVDISSLESILKFKDSLGKWLGNTNMHSSIQLLINNAGILAASNRITEEGYDEMIGTNYLGAFFMVKILLPLLRNSPVSSRIVNVTSFTHRCVFDIQMDKETVTGRKFLQLKRYPCGRLYEYSKVFLLLFTYQLHRQLHSKDETRHVSIIAADPGVVETNIMREVPSYLSRLAFMVLKLLGLLQSPEVGIDSILDAALAPLETSGVYFFGGKGRTLKSSTLSYSIELAEKLWTLSSDLFLELKLASGGCSTSG